MLDDPTPPSAPKQVTRLVLCSGKVYVDLMAARARAKAADNVAVARVEELYPFPATSCARRSSATPTCRRSSGSRRSRGTWAPGRYIAPALRELGRRTRSPVRYEGRPDRASPAEGYADMHAAEQARIVRAAWEGPSAPQRARTAKRA